MVQLVKNERRIWKSEVYATWFIQFSACMQNFGLLTQKTYL